MLGIRHVVKIIEECVSRRQYLRTRHCSENLAFYIEVENFKIFAGDPTGALCLDYNGAKETYFM